MATAARLDTLEQDLAAACGNAAARTDAAALELYGQDVFTAGARPRAVVRPATIEALGAAVAACARHGAAIIPRGGGMSYTSGYLGPAGAVVIDIAGMDRVLSVSEADMTAHVEAGCTWATLYKRLKPMGLRAPMWGTLSGRYATIGGGMSQNGAFWGSGLHGPASASAIAFQVVLADGSLLRTGGSFRPYGPDLTGLFVADAGALGIKAAVTLRLISEAAALANGSFTFAEANAVFTAMAAISREGLAAECFAFDPYLQQVRMRRDSLASDAKALIGMMRAQRSVFSALKEGAKVAAAGRNFLGEGWSVHVNCEGRNQASADADLARVRRIMAEHGGREAENSIPKVLRANPFGPVNSMLGPEGERWVPVHGIVPHGSAGDAHAAIRAVFAAEAAEMERLGIGAGALILTLGHGHTLIEPVFYWPDARAALHDASVEPAHLAKLKRFEANPPARALVEQLRADVIGVFSRAGAAHFQIGRAYPWAAAQDARGLEVLRALKQAVDPQNLMNPGALFGPA